MLAYHFLGKLEGRSFPMQIVGIDALALEFGMFSRKCASLAGLALFIVDYSAVFATEFRFIFKSPIRTVKCLYLFARLFGIASQIILGFFLFGPLSSLPVRPETCHKWFSFQIISFAVLQVSIEIILVLRAYALYRKSLKVALILITAVLIEMALCIYYSVHSIHLLDYDTACIVIGIPKEIIFLGACVIVTQCTIWGSTLWKCLKEGGVKVPVVSIVMRDGGVSFIAIIAMIIISIPFRRPKNIAHMIMPFATSALSVISCRLIINFRDQSPDPPSDDVELNSAFELTTFESCFTIDSVSDPGSSTSYRRSVASNSRSLSDHEVSPVLESD